MTKSISNNKQENNIVWRLYTENVFKVQTNNYIFKIIIKQHSPSESDLSKLQ